MGFKRIIEKEKLRLSAKRSPPTKRGLLLLAEAIKEELIEHSVATRSNLIKQTLEYLTGSSDEIQYLQSKLEGYYFHPSTLSRLGIGIIKFADASRKYIEKDAHHMKCDNISSSDYLLYLSEDSLVKSLKTAHKETRVEKYVHYDFNGIL